MHIQTIKPRGRLLGAIADWFRGDTHYYTRAHIMPDGEAILEQRNSSNGRPQIVCLSPRQVDDMIAGYPAAKNQANTVGVIQRWDINEGS